MHYDDALSLKKHMNNNLCNYIFIVHCFLIGDIIESILLGLVFVFIQIWLDTVLYFRRFPKNH